MPGALVGGVHLLHGDHLIDHAKRYGLCTICAETRTHQKVGKFLLKAKWVPKGEVFDERNNLIVYKGYCLKPTCHTLHDVKIKLGESKSRGGRHARNNDDPITGQQLDFSNRPNNPRHVAHKSIGSATARLEATEEPSGASPFGESSSSLHSGESAVLPQYSDPRSHYSSLDLDGSGQLLDTIGSHGSNGNYHGCNISSNSDNLNQRNLTPGISIIQRINANGQPNNHHESGGTDTLHSSSSRLCGFEDAPTATSRGSSGGNMSRSEEEKEEVSSQNLIIHEIQDAARYGDVTELVSLLERNRSNKEAIKTAFVLLCECVHKAHQTKERLICVFVNDSWVKSVNTVITDNLNDEEIQVLGVAVYAVLSRVSRRYMLDICKHGGLKIVMSTLKKYKRNEHAVNICFCALFCMTDTKPIVPGSSVRQSGLTMHSELAIKAIEGIIDSVAFADRVGKYWAFNCLFNLSLQSVPVGDRRIVFTHLVKASGSGQGIEMLIDALKASSSNERLALTGLRLLNRFCEAYAENESYVIASQELVSMVFSLISSSSSEDVHEAAFIFISNVDLDQTSLSHGNLIKLSESVSSYMAAYQDNEDLQIAAMASVSRLLRPSDQRDLITEWDDLASTIIVSMRTHLKNMDLQRHGCLALSTIASGNDSCKLSIVSNGGVAVLSKAIARHVIGSEDSSAIIIDLRLYACTLFASLAACPLTSRALSGEDFMAPFMKMMQASSNELPDFVRSSMAAVIAAGAQMNADQQYSSAKFAMDSLLASRTREEAEMMILTLVDLCKRSLKALTALMVAEGCEGISYVLAFMSQYIESLTIQEAGCEILAEIFARFPFQGQLGLPFRLQVGPGMFTVFPHFEKELISIGKAVVIHKSKASLVAKAFSARSMFLAGLASQGNIDNAIDNRVEMRLAGSFRDCKDALVVHQDNMDVQNRCLGLIRYLLFLQDKTEFLRWRSDLIEGILTTLRVHQDDAEIQVSACSTLLAIFCVEEDDKVIKSMDGKEFARLLLICMQSESEDLAEIASELVACLLPRAVALVGDLADSQGAMESIISCLFRFRSKATIVCNCCSILVSVTTLHDNYVVPVIAQNGGVSAILDAINNHRRDEMVQECACKAFMGVSRGIPQNMLEEMKVHIAETTARALQENIANPDTEAALLEVVWYLCSRDNFFKEWFSRKNLVAVIVEAMNHNLYDRSVQGGGCTSLWSLSSFDDNKKTIGDSGGLRCILNALLAHLDAIRIQKEGLTALKNLATTSRNKQLITAFRGEEVIILCLRGNMARSEEVVAAAFSALNNIAVDTVTRMVSKAPALIFECILIAMRRFTQSEAVQNNACFLLKSYTFSAENITSMRKWTHEFITVLSFAAEHFSSSCGERASYVSNMLYEDSDLYY